MKFGNTSKMQSEAWVIYKCHPNTPGWETRLLHNGACTQILCEQWWSSGDMPEVGDRPREYADLPDVETGASSTHGRDSDWLVTKVERFTSADTNRMIYVCWCEYSESQAEWEEIPVSQGLIAAIAEGEAQLDRGEGIPYKPELMEALVQDVIDTIHPPTPNKIHLEPTPIPYDEFSDCCPNISELYAGYLGGSMTEATNILDMSLASFGLLEVVKRVPKELWEDALRQVYGDSP